MSRLGARVSALCERVGSDGHHHREQHERRHGHRKQAPLPSAGGEPFTKQVPAVPPFEDRLREHVVEDLVPPRYTIGVVERPHDPLSPERVEDISSLRCVHVRERGEISGAVRDLRA